MPARQRKQRVLVPGQRNGAGERGSGDRGSENNSVQERGSDRNRVELGHGAAAFSRVFGAVARN